MRTKESRRQRPKRGASETPPYEELGCRKARLGHLDRTVKPKLMSERSEANKQLEAAEGRAHELEGPGGFWAFMVTTESALEDDVIRLQGRMAYAPRRSSQPCASSSGAFLDNYPEFQAPRPVAAPIVVHRGALSYRGLGGAEGIGAKRLPYRACRSQNPCGLRNQGGRDVVASAPDSLGAEIARTLWSSPTHIPNHVGWLPALARQVGGFEIIATKPTHELIHRDVG